MVIVGLVVLAGMVFAEAWQTGGIGVAIIRKATDEPLRVALVFPGSPAETAGIKTNWFLISVNGTNVISMSGTEFFKVLTGPVGTAVTVEVANPTMTQTNKFTIRRANVRMPDELFPRSRWRPEGILIAR